MTTSTRPLLNLLVIGPGGAGATTLTRCLAGEGGGLFATENNNYVAIDASADPRRTLQQLMQGAVVADGIILVTDVTGKRSEEIERAARLVSILNVDQVVVALNRADRLSSPAKLDEGRERVRQSLERAGVIPLAFIPVSAEQAKNVCEPDNDLPGGEGPTLTEALDGFEAMPAMAAQPLRLPITAVVDKQGSRFYEGRLKSGVLMEGDQVLFSPSNAVARIARVQIVDGGRYAQIAHSGDQVSLLLDTEAQLPEGELLSHVDDAPIESDVFRGKIWWLQEESLTVGSRLGVDVGVGVVDAEVEKISHVMDPVKISKPSSDSLPQHHVGEVVLRADHLVALDTREICPANARLQLLQGDRLSGTGFVSMEGYADQRNAVTVRATNVTRVAHQVRPEARVERHQHRGGVLWFTGLSGAGKSTLAVEVERALFENGYEVYVLDGDNIRHGLNADLGFSPEDRSENIRRIGEVAALFSRAGVIAISAFISPYRSDRARARAAAGDDFHEIYIKASLEVCEQRDPKGLYARARSGDLKEFTGVSAPYEAPEMPDLIVDTAVHDVATCVEKVVDYVGSKLSSNGGPPMPGS